MITQERLKELLHYDPETGIFMWIAKRSGALHDRPAGTTDQAGYLVIKIDGKSHKGHRLAWLYMKGALPAGLMDHKNLVRNDNKWGNIRAATRTLNSENQRHAHSQSKTGFLGVRVNRDKYQAKITVHGNAICLGTYDTPCDAYEAYLRAKRKWHEGCTL